MLGAWGVDNIWVAFFIDTFRKIGWVHNDPINYPSPAPQTKKIYFRKPCLHNMILISGLQLIGLLMGINQYLSFPGFENCGGEKEIQPLTLLGIFNVVVYKPRPCSTLLPRIQRKQHGKKYTRMKLVQERSDRIYSAWAQDALPATGSSHSAFSC